jgi:hypothetical protein
MKLFNGKRNPLKSTSSEDKTEKVAVGEKVGMIVGEKDGELVVGVRVGG